MLFTFTPLYYAEQTTKKSMTPFKHKMARLLAKKEKADQMAAATAIVAGKGLVWRVMLMNIFKWIRRKGNRRARPELMGNRLSKK